MDMRYFIGIDIWKATLTSVPGVGSTTATEVIVATNEFKAINKPKKLACHAGVAPFEYKSGSSVRTVGRTYLWSSLKLLEKRGGPSRTILR